MTEKEFYEKHCKYCGTQRCPADAEAISICGYYKGNIEGIEKKQTINYDELLKIIHKKQKEKTKEFEEYDRTYKEFMNFIKEKWGLDN